MVRNDVLEGEVMVVVVVVLVIVVLVFVFMFVLGCVGCVKCMVLDSVDNGIKDCFVWRMGRF
jgi:hypothetical protein